MALTPLTAITWLDPPARTDYTVGQAVTLRVQFLDPVLKTPAAPDIITFSTEQPGVSPAVTTVYPASPSASAGTGLYSIPFALTNPGKTVLSVLGQNNPGPVSVAYGEQIIDVYPTGT